MKRSTLSIIIILFLSCSKLTSFAQPSFERFTDAEIAYMPSLQGITSQTVVDLQKGSVVLNNRQWQFVGKNDSDRDAIIKDGPGTFGIQSSPAFRLPLFSLHKNGIWVFPIRLVHNTAMVTNENGSRQRQCYNVDIFTRLSTQEQTLPLFQRLIYPETYEECLDFDVYSPDYLRLTIYQFSIFTCCLREELDPQTLVDTLSSIDSMKCKFEQRRTPENSKTLDALLQKIDMVAEALKDPEEESDDLEDLYKKFLMSMAATLEEPKDPNDPDTAKKLDNLVIQLEELGSFERLEELGGISLLNPLVEGLEDRGILAKYQQNKKLEPQEAQDLIAFLTSCVDFLRQQSAMS